MQAKEEEIGLHPSLSTDFYCLHLPVDSAAMFDRHQLKEVGIGSPWDVGRKLVEIFESKIKQSDIAAELKSFLHTRSQNLNVL